LLGRKSIEQEESELFLSSFAAKGLHFFQKTSIFPIRLGDFSIDPESVWNSIEVWWSSASTLLVSLRGEDVRKIDDALYACQEAPTDVAAIARLHQQLDVWFLHASPNNKRYATVQQLRELVDKIEQQLTPDLMLDMTPQLDN